MAKAKRLYGCTECGATFPKWAGQCGECGAWNTLVETVVSYASPEALQQVINMGLKEGLASTLERLDELLLVLN